MKKVLVTGANGFIGTSLCACFETIGIPYRKAVRTGGEGPGDTVAVGDIDGRTDWTGALTGIDCVVHLAARVHVMQEDADDPLDAFRKVNRDGTLRLAGQAAAAGVRRFVYISTIKVHGEETCQRPFRADDKPCPADPYAISKLEAEQGLAEISLQTGMEFVVIRPPLVYGREAGGNFQRLRSLVKKGWYLPLGSIDNKRSLVSVENLCDLITVCLEHPGAAGRIVLVSDCHDVSTPVLITLLAEMSGRPVRLLPFPIWLLHLLGALTGKKMEIRRLTGSLQVDSAETCSLLDWQPPVSLEDGLKKSVEGV